MMSQVWANSACAGTDLLMLLAIADFADDSGSAYPSVNTLARKIRVKERAAQYVLRNLEQAGELRIVKKGGGRFSNRYQILTPATSCTGATACTPPAVQPTAPQRCNTLQGSGATAIAPEPSSNHQKNHHEYAHAFEEAWQSYPERAGDDPKLLAYKQWQARVKEGHAEQELIEGARRYAIYIDAKGDTGTQFVMQARKFFGETKPFKSAWKPPRGASKRADFGAQDYTAGLA